MDFTGKWACTEYKDTQLNVMPDGAVYVSHAKLGEYSVRAENVTFTEESLTWTACGMTWTVGDSGLNENPRSLKATIRTEERCEESKFYQAPAEPEALPYHHAPFFEPIEVPAEFPMTVGELVGRWCHTGERNDAFNKRWTGGYGLIMEMNIFEQDRKILLVLTLDGETRWCPKSVWIDRDELVWQINDSYNRGTCTLKKADGMLAGTYRQLWHDPFPGIWYTKVSDIPVEYPANLPTMNVELPNGSRLEILRANAVYGEKEDVTETEFVLGGELPEIVNEFDYQTYVDGKSGDDLAFACLDFICDHFRHYGSSGMPNWKERSLAQMMEWCKGHDGKTNCRGLSILLSALLRYNGIRAGHVTCQPYEDPFDDCHVVVDCILPSGARVMLDPTYRLYFKDTDGAYVSLRGLREILIGGGTLIPNETAAYTGENDGFNLDSYRDYMAKNTLRFSKDRVYADGRDEFEAMWLFPVGYPAEKVCDPEKVIVKYDPVAFWN